MLPLLSGLKSPGASISKGRWLTVQEVRLQRQEAIVGRAAKESSAGNSERQSLKGRFVLDLSRFGSPVRLDVTAFADKVRSDKWLLLAACLLIDFIGDWALFGKALPCHCASFIRKKFRSQLRRSRVVVDILQEWPATSSSCLVRQKGTASRALRCMMHGETLCMQTVPS